MNAVPARARVVLLTGPSGCGKTRLSARSGLPVLELDGFYREGTEPDLPARPGGDIDWESPGAWNAGEAMAAVLRLCTERRAEVPTYDFSTDRRTGATTLDLGDAPVFVAEGIFAAELVAACRADGVLADAIVLRNHRMVTFWRRLLRDLRERRKPPLTLVRTGWRKFREEPHVIHRNEQLGARCCTWTDAEHALRALAGGVVAAS